MSSASDAQTFQILLVEDNAADIYLLREALKRAGLTFELTVIDNGGEALAFARRDGKYATSLVPDLAVIDLNLPKNGGIEVLGALRRNGDLSNVPVAVMTTSAALSEQAKVRELGIARFITKPHDLEDFLHIGEVLKQVLLESTAPAEPSV